MAANPADRTRDNPLFVPSSLGGATETSCEIFGRPMSSSPYRINITRLIAVGASSEGDIDSMEDSGPSMSAPVASTNISQLHPLTIEPNAPSHLHRRGYLSPYDTHELGIVAQAAPTRARTAMENITLLSSDDAVIGSSVRRIGKKMHTGVYLDYGYITEDELAEDGLYHDEYESRERRYIAVNGKRVAVARQIESDPKRGIVSLPTAEHFSVDPQMVTKVAGVPSLAELKPHQVVEISGLASRYLDGHEGEGGEFDAVIAVYSQMLAASLVRGEKLWLMNIDDKLLANLRFMVGKEQVHVAGEKSEYMGPATQPVLMSPQQVVRTLLTSTHPRQQKYAAHLRACLEGVNERYIPKDIRKLLAEQGTSLHKRTLFEKTTDGVREHPIESAIGAAAIVLSLVRAFPASGVEGFTGDTATLWGIDMGTLPSYIGGIHYMHHGSNQLTRWVGTGFAVASFMAPYVYYYAKRNRDYPVPVHGVVAIFAGYGVMKEVLRLRKNSHLARQLARIPQE